MKKAVNPRSTNPFTALPNHLFGILEGYEWGVLMALRYHGCECYPSQKRIAELAGVSIRTVQRTLESLKSKRLISWEPRILEDGQQSSNLYILHIGDGWGESTAALSAPPLPTDVPPRPTDVPPRPTVVPPTSHSRTPHVPQAYKQDLLEQDLREPIEPPYPPLTRGAPKPDTPDLPLPPELEPLREGIMEFWNENKAGKKTKRAWSDLVKNLLKILKDKDGGADCVKEQLERAEQARIHGKGWSSITYANWLCFGKKRQSTSGPGAGYSRPPAPRPGPKIMTKEESEEYDRLAKENLLRMMYPDRYKSDKQNSQETFDL